MNDNLRGVIIASLIVLNCCDGKVSENSRPSQTTDSLVMTTLGQREQALWLFYQNLERGVKEEGIPDDSIDQYIQKLIDDGLIAPPEICLDSENGTECKTVSYRSYKKFRSENPIELERGYVVVSPDDGGFSSDSAREVIVKALKEKSVDSPGSESVDSATSGQ